jgi:hypothetical protein
MELARLLYTDEAAFAEATRLFNSYVARDPESEALITRLTEESGLANSYAYSHALRFRDQIRAAAAVRSRRLEHQPLVRLLDVGQAPVTLLYAQVIKGMDLYTANLDMGSPAEAEMLKYGSLRHYPVDFDKESLSGRYPELAARPFDIIVYCEVAEHVRASPTEQIRDLLSILSPGGALILSTPNALSHDRIQKLVTGRKADSIYSREQRFLHDDHHIHIREFTVTEMLDAVRAAGGETMLFGIADYYAKPDGNMVRSNYVSSREVQTLIITHGGTAMPG